MADTTRTKDPLELAAASPDPAVRQLALRLKELEVEMAPLRTFFATYASAEPDSAPIRQAAKAVSATTGDAVVARVRDILRRDGPLDLDGLYERYRAAVPEDSGRTREALRVALSKRKGDVGRVSDEDRRYWPVGMPLNGAHAAVV